MRYILMASIAVALVVGFLCGSYFAYNDVEHEITRFFDETDTRCGK